jgi:TonB family protein
MNIKALFFLLAISTALCCQAGEPPLGVPLSQIEPPAGTCPKPAWPKDALAAGADGVATIGIYVTADGSVTNTVIMHSTGNYSLDRASIKQSANCRLAAGKLDGEPQSMWVLMTMIWVVPNASDNGTLLQRHYHAAEEGDIEALYSLAQIVEGENNLSSAIAIMKQAAELGHPTAQYALGSMYLVGTKLERNEQEGLRLLRAAAAQKHIMAIDHLRLLNQSQIEQSRSRGKSST